METKSADNAFTKPLFKSGLLKEHATLVGLIARMLDLFVITLSAFIITKLQLQHWFLASDYQILVSITALLVITIFPKFAVYRSWRGTGIIFELQTVMGGWLAVWLVLLTLGFSTNTTLVFPWEWLLSYFGLGLVFLFGLRICLRRIISTVRAKGYNRRDIIILGAGDLAKNIIAQLHENAWAGLKVVGLFDDAAGLLGKKIHGVTILGKLDLVKQYLQNNPIDQVWLALPLRAELRVKAILQLLVEFPVEIKFVPDIFSFTLVNHKLSEMVGIPVISLSETPMHGVSLLLKEMEDKLLASMILLAIAPLLIGIAIGVKLSSNGTVLFKQARHGWDGKKIIVYKFRTMYTHAEDDGKVTQAKKNDSRVTKFGAFLRRTSLDELPQFINVLQGRMSIVGPRPHAVEHNELYKKLINSYMLRHLMKPGITGWAQVNGWRGETDTLEKMRKRVEFDLFYIENWSLLFDLKIILLTIKNVFFDRNAY